MGSLLRGIFIYSVSAEIKSAAAATAVIIAASAAIAIVIVSAAAENYNKENYPTAAVTAKYTIVTHCLCPP